MKFQRIYPLVTLLIVMACGVVSPKESNEANEPITSTGATNTPAVQQTEESQGEPFITASDLANLQLITNTQGVGEKPLFQWEAAPTASYYQLVVFDDGGKPYWAWEGKTTQIYLGGTVVQPPADSSGPIIAQGYSWTVVAFDIQDRMVAASAVRAISP